MKEESATAWDLADSLTSFPELCLARTRTVQSSDKKKKRTLRSKLCHLARLVKTMAWKMKMKDIIVTWKQHAGCNVPWDVRSHKRTLIPSDPVASG